jgi:hypothetical protein
MLHELVRHAAVALGEKPRIARATVQATTSDFMGRLNPFGCG